MEKRNTMLLTVVAIATLLVAVVGATFAYFTATGELTDSSTVTVTTSSHDSTVADSANVSLIVTQADMDELNSTSGGTPIGENATPGNVKLETKLGSGGGTSVCTYDLIYTPTLTGGFTVFNNTPINTSNLTELAIGFKTTTQGSNTSITPTTFNADWVYKDLNGIGSVDTPDLKIVEGATLTVTGVNGEGSVTWSILPVMYNHDFIQDVQAGKMFGGIVAFDDVSCTNTGN